MTTRLWVVAAALLACTGSAQALVITGHDEDAPAWSAGHTGATFSSSEYGVGASVVGGGGKSSDGLAIGATAEKSPGAEAQLPAVPEPGSYPLMLAGLAMILFLAWRNRDR